jgi:hypothetical protein
MILWVYNKTMRKLLLIFSIALLISLCANAGTIAPTITNVKFNERTIINNDYIEQDAVLTATVTDVGSGISTTESKVIVDGQATTFANLIAPASYEVSSGLLVFDLSLNTGTHTVEIQAVDNNSNVSTYQRTVKVDTGTVVTTLTLVYPNPYNPNNGDLLIAYKLSKDTNVQIYIFNEINQLIWRRSNIPGFDGGAAGYNEIGWDGKDSNGRSIPNGAYFMRLVVGGRLIGKAKIAVLR